MLLLGYAPDAGCDVNPPKSEPTPALGVEKVPGLANVPEGIAGW
jgi:hypothetical protein